MLKVLLFILIALGSTTAYSQIVQPVELQLMLPRGSEDDKATAEDYKHSLELKKDEAILTLKGKKRTVQIDKLPAIIKKNKAAIKPKAFSIIVNKETTYKQIVDALDLMTINKIKQYKLVSAWEDVVQL